MSELSNPIPIQNIYYLLCYAWNRLEEGEIVNVSDIGVTEIVDLFARVLASGTNHLLRRGLDQDYLPVADDVAGIRGRVNLTSTMTRMLEVHGKTNCSFDEFSVDTLPNQILKATMRLLMGADSLDNRLRKTLSSTYRNFGNVTNVRLTRSVFRRVQLHRNNRFYRFLLEVCRLVLDSSIIDERTGNATFREFYDDDRMGKLFEDFVFNFYRVELEQENVTRESIRWNATSKVDASLDFLPEMRTDISLRNELRTMIIDTKFYRQTLQSYYDKKTIHSSNLYQLFAYLKNVEDRGGHDATADGMLLYPVVSEKLRLEYEIPNHRIRVCTLDLAADWQAIRQELFELAA